MSVVLPDVVLDDSSEATPPYPDDDTFDLSPRQQPSLNSSQHSGMELGRLLIRRDREREGRCGNCGIQTFEWFWNPLHQVAPIKIPLTIPSEVHRGRCLLCHPIPENRTQGNQEEFLDLSPLSPPSARPKAQRRISDYGRRGLTDDLVDGSDEGHDPRVRIAIRALERADICDILHVMKRLPHIGALQTLGCEKLWILSWDDENATSIGSVGGISLIVQAMVRFPHNDRLQQCACEALQNLAAHEANRCKIAESGGIFMIVQAMVRHSRSAQIQQCACTALASLAHNYPHEICRVGGLHAVVVAARHFNQTSGVVRAAYEAVQSMGISPRGRLPSLLNVFTAQF
jgi:hypothetical protein